MNEYSEFILRLLPLGTEKGKYQIEAVVDGLGFWTGGQIALSATDLDDSASPLDYGRQLWAKLVSGWSELGSILGKSSRNIRFRLMLDQTPELHDLKWEFLVPRDDSGPIGVDQMTPVSRFLALPTSFDENARSGLKILLAIASPSDLKKPLEETGVGLKAIQVGEEIKSFLDVLEREIREGQVELTVLAGQTPLNPDLIQRLQALNCEIVAAKTTMENIGIQLNGKHVLHLIAHGDFRNGKSILTLEADDGKTDAARPDDPGKPRDFVTNWSGSKPRLIFLQSCRSDYDAPKWISAGLGPAFVKKGVPAVVAMRDFVEMQAARKFAAGFYRNLVRTGEVDQAANAGRREAYETNNGDWAIPVLYSGLRSSQRLWKPDPLRSSIHELSRKLKDRPEVTKPFPVEVTVFKNLEVARQELESPTSFARVDALTTAAKELRSPTSNPTLLIGGRGRAKSSLLTKLFVDLASDAEIAAKSPPILVNLADCVNASSPVGAIASAWSANLEKNNIPADRERIERQLADGNVLVLIDCQDLHGGETFDDCLDQVTAFLKSAPGRFALFAMDQTVFNPENFKGMAPTVLIIQDLRPATLKTYLDSHYSGLNDELRRQLAGPFSDLAGIPCLLSRILELAGGRPIASRFSILNRIVKERLAKNSGTPGFYSLGTDALRKMAWCIQSSAQPHLTAEDTYPFLIAARGSRDFHLEDFRKSLINSELLVGAGPENLRFAYASAHAYFTACYLYSLNARELKERLAEIVPSLRSAQPLKKWQEVLLLLSGQMEEPGDLIAMLLDLGFGEGEHLLLAARCIHEAACNGKSIDPALLSQVTDSLIWWSSCGNGLRPRSRRRAVRGLAYLLRQRAKTEEIVCHLLQLAIGQFCAGPGNRFQLDYSPVRLDAMSLLFRNYDLTLPHIEADLAGHPDCAQVSQFIAKWRAAIAKTEPGSKWSEATVADFAADLNDPDADCQCPAKSLGAGLAAFALMTDGSSAAIDCVVKRFLRNPINPDLHWLIADGLITLQASEAAKLVKLAVEHPDEYNPALAGFVVYAIGRLGSTLTVGETLDEKNPLWQYLAKHLKSENVVLKGRSLRASAEVLSTSANPKTQDLRELCHDILLGQHEKSGCLWGDGQHRDLTPDDAAKLKKYAIEALEQIGNESSLDVLRKFYLQRMNGKPIPEIEPLRKISWDAAEKIRLRTPQRRASQKRDSV